MLLLSKKGGGPHILTPLSHALSPIHMTVHWGRGSRLLISASSQSAGLLGIMAPLDYRHLLTQAHAHSQARGSCSSCKLAKGVGSASHLAGVLSLSTAPPHTKAGGVTSGNMAPVSSSPRLSSLAILMCGISSHGRTRCLLTHKGLRHPRRASLSLSTTISVATPLTSKVVHSFACT